MVRFALILRALFFVLFCAYFFEAFWLKRSPLAVLLLAVGVVVVVVGF